MSLTKIEKRPLLLKLLTNIGVEANQHKWPATVSVRPANVKNTFAGSFSASSVTVTSIEGTSYTHYCWEPLVLQQLVLKPLVLQQLV